MKKQNKSILTHISKIAIQHRRENYTKNLKLLKLFNITFYTWNLRCIKQNMYSLYSAICICNLYKLVNYIVSEPI